SREDDILRLFFDEPTREWHFEEIVREAKMARSKADAWLKRLIKENLVKRVKERKKMPHYISNYKASDYQNRKRLFALGMLYDSGLLNHLTSLQKARTVIIFGSFARWDWHKKSDIDVFVYGDTEGLSIGKYELKLHRDIEMFAAKDKDDIRKFGPGLVKNIIKGYVVKGELDFVEVNTDA
ncbi:MAG: nucleotidyltransferase domain-containing protein, partial [Nanoarchaeota archaeon]